MPSTRRARSRERLAFAHAQRQLADVLAVADQTVEGIELDFVVVLAAVQAVEVRNAVYAEQDGLPVDHERGVPVAQRGLGDQRIAVAPVVAVAGEQAHALALALDDQAVAVVLDFVKPVRPGRNLGSARRDAGLERSSPRSATITECVERK